QRVRELRLPVDPQHAGELLLPAVLGRGRIVPGRVDLRAAQREPGLSRRDEAAPDPEPVPAALRAARRHLLLHEAVGQSRTSGAPAPAPPSKWYPLAARCAASLSCSRCFSPARAAAAPRLPKERTCRSLPSGSRRRVVHGSSRSSWRERTSRAPA